MRYLKHLLTWALIWAALTIVGAFALSFLDQRPSVIRLITELWAIAAAIFALVGVHETTN